MTLQQTAYSDRFIFSFCGNYTMISGAILILLTDMWILTYFISHCPDRRLDSGISVSCHNSKDIGVTNNFLFGRHDLLFSGSGIAEVTSEPSKIPFHKFVWWKMCTAFSSAVGAR